MSGSAPVTSHCPVARSISHESMRPRSTDRARRRRSNSACSHQAWFTRSAPPVAIARSFPSTHRTRLGIITWPCRCGSRAREWDSMETVAAYPSPRIAGATCPSPSCPDRPCATRAMSCVEGASGCVADEFEPRRRGCLRGRGARRRTATSGTSGSSRSRRCRARSSTPSRPSPAPRPRGPSASSSMLTDRAAARHRQPACQSSWSRARWSAPRRRMTSRAVEPDAPADRSARPAARLAS